MDEIEKFKRKLIRTVMTVRLREGQPYEAAWQELKKDTGRDCEMLWNRMCAITRKKLCRLLAADDERARVPPGARLATADWLLVDLVLVHDKTDAIGAEVAGSKEGSEPAGELPALRRLFQLAVKYELQDCSAFTRTRRWVQLTHEYNKEGRECSPMLLQLRWYQMKRRVRDQFYDFWHAYRGNKTNLLKATTHQPRQLDIDIARVFPSVVTEVFPEWSQLVLNRGVILPEHFNRFGRTARDLRPLYKGDLFIMRASLKAKPVVTIDTEPDLVIVEPQIDTIELDGDSETEETENQEENNKAAEEVSTPTDVDAAVANITGLSEEDGLSNVQIVQATSVITEEIDSEMPVEPICEDTESPVNKEDLADVVPESQLSDNKTPSAAIASFIAGVISGAMDVEEEVDVTETVSEPEELGSSTSNTPTPTPYDVQNEQSPKQPDMVEEVLKEKLDAIKETPAEEHEIDSDENDSLFTKEATADINLQDLVGKIKEELTEDTNKPESGEDITSMVIGELPTNLELIDDGIDFDEDDEEDDIIMMDNCSRNIGGTPEEIKQEESEEEIEEPEEQAKFDLKLIMLPVVYTTKVEFMKCLKHSDYEHVDTSAIIDLILEESKPVSALSVNIKHDVEVSFPEIKTEKNETEDLIKISEATYEVPLEAPDMNGSEDLVKITESNVVATKIEAMEATDDSDSSDDVIPECQRVKLTSKLFKKPESRNYNPIKLCKNPDFNTRLRRLTAGFLTYESNRGYLTRLIPITIDLHKSFEQKLIDKTIYLVPDPNASKPALNKQEHLVTATVPTAMPASTFTKSEGNNETVNLIDEELAQRKYKAIELPDIAKVRRMNQQLLTAEVSPLQVINNPTTDNCLEISPLSICNRVIEEKISDDASSHALQDNHPVLEAPKAGETVKVKVELIDDDDDVQISAPTMNSEKAPTPEPVKNETQPESTKATNTALEAVKPKKHKYTPKGTKEYPKRPWYMPPLTPINSHFEIKDNDPAKPPWWKQNLYNPTDTSLLTHDTLNKMILLIEGKEEKDKTNKKKSHKKHPGPPPPKPVEHPCIDLSTEGRAPEPAKPKSEIVVDLTPHKTCRTRVRNLQNPAYCCYFNRVNYINARRLRSNNRRTWRPKHKCPANGCTCCCREGDSYQPKRSQPDKPNSADFPGDREMCCWASRMISIFKDSKKYDALKWMPMHDCLKVGNRQCKCCCKAALETVAGVVEKICEHAKETDEMKEITSAVSLINKPIAEFELIGKRPAPAATVIDEGTVPFENILHTNLTTRNDSPSIPGASTQSTEVSKEATCLQSIDVDSDTNSNTATHLHIQTAAQATPERSRVTVQSAPSFHNTAARPVNTSTDSDQFILLSDDETDSAPAAPPSVCFNSPIVGPAISLRPTLKPLSCYKPRRVIVPPKPKFVIKCFKNLMDACPVRLGPKKILLTTAKIPADILLPQPKITVPTLAPPTSCLTNVDLPKGVYLVMDPDNGTLSAAFEPNTNLDKSTLQDVKNIVSIVQEQLNKQVLVPAAPSIVGDTVTLSDDENSGDKAAEPSISGDRGESDHQTAQEESSNVAAECTQPMDTPEGPEKTVTEEVKQVALNNPEKFMEVTENLADGTLPHIVKGINNDTADVSSTVDEVPSVINTVDVVPIVTNTVDAVPNVTNTVNEIPSITNTVDEVADVTNTVDEVRNVTNPVDEVLNVTNTVDEVLSTTNTVDEITKSLVDGRQPDEKLSEEHTATENSGDGAPTQLVNEVPENQAYDKESPEDEEKSEQGLTQGLEVPISEEAEQNVTLSSNENATQSEMATEMTEPGNNMIPMDIEYPNEVVVRENDQMETQTAQPKKSILSDLMEMSGISSEDVLPTAEDVPMPFMPEPPPPPAVVLDPSGPTELTQVTNVTALRYAVAQKAQFFRYTINTGALAAIEVALQSSRVHHSIPQGPTPVVDLTEPYSVQPKTVTPVEAPRRRGRPIIIKKVIGTRPPFLTLAPATETARSLLKPTVVRLEERRKRGRPRKQLIEPTLYNLDATDGEMEEEYLLDSEQDDATTDDRQTISVLLNLLELERAKRDALTNPDRGSSSDDEPLIKKVKRKKTAKKLKKKVKLVKKQLRLIQKSKGTYSIAEKAPVQAMPDSVAEELAKEGEAWLDRSDEETDNFILGA